MPYNEYTNTAAQPSGVATKILRSDDLNDIISRKPSFFTRWALLCFLVILIALVYIAWIIQYPDIVVSKAVLTSVNAPKAVVCRTEGKVVKIKIREGQQVNAGDILGFIESTADHQQVIELSKKIDTISSLVSNSHIERLAGQGLEGYKALGELQQSFQIFVQAYITFRSYLSDGYFIRKKVILSNDMGNLQRLQASIEEQKKIQLQDLALAQRTFSANDTLKMEKVISELEYRNEKSKLLNKQLTISQTNDALIANGNQQNEKQKEIQDLNNTIMQQQSIFYQALNTFKSQIDDWKKKFLLTAPITGTIAFAMIIEENQQVRPGQTFCFINPKNTGIYAETFIPQDNFGKIRSGQKVILKFESYPSQEYGSLVGKITFISKVPTDSGYFAKIALSSLVTNYNKPLQYRDGLVATAQIITLNSRLLEKFYYNFKQQLQR